MSTTIQNALYFRRPFQSVNNVQKNQDVTLSISSGTITVTSQQSFSTPGIFFSSNIKIPKGEVYEFVVKGRSVGSASAYLWGDLTNDHSTRITAITTDSTTYLPSTTGSVSAIIGGFDRTQIVRIGVLFETPSVGDQFEVESVAVVQRQTVKLGDWTLYDMPSNLVINNRNTSGEWKFVGAFQKES